VSARKIGFLILILAFGGVVEIAWSVRENRLAFGPEGLRILGGRFYGPSFEFEESTQRAVSADDPLEVEVRNSFGAVRILPGGEDSVRVVLRKVVFQPTEEKARAFAEQVELRIDEEDGRLRVGTNRNDVDRRARVGFETHLEVHVPARSSAVVQSDHGPVEARGVAEADLRASFDDIRAEQIDGPVSIDGRHGTIEASDLGGSLTLKSRHGDVEVTGVQGSVNLDVQHGAVAVRRTAGVEAQLSFGRIVAESIEGDLTLEARHVGVQITDVAGRADAKTSYEGISIEGVGGDASARVEHGSIRASKVKGGVRAQSTQDGVWLEDVDGPVEVTVQGGGLEARGLGQGARVRARGDDVSIVGFRGPIDVEAEGGDVFLSPRRPIMDAVTVTAKHGDLRLEVPAGSRFDLEAESRHGALSLDVPELAGTGATPTLTGGRASGRVGGGGAVVRLIADDDVPLAPAVSAPPAEQP